MKKALFISLSFSVILLSVVLYLLTTSQKYDSYRAANVAQTTVENKSCCSEKEVGKVSENSIYQLESVWKTESGKKMVLGDFRGEKIIMAMIFTTCSYACPLIVNDMKKIEAEIKRSDIKFLLISIDPKRDTPETLKKYAENNKLDLKNWRLLTSDENSVSELAAVLGFKYKQEPDGSFSHSNIINVLNEKGEVAFQHFGLNQDVQDVSDKIKKL